MTFQTSLRRTIFVAMIALICALYLANLTGMGLITVDEPRYADIGRAMAQSGDWITPRLWGQPWFEKPALLYWMTGAGFRLGLGPELAPRLPVALLSFGFLVFFWWRVRIEWGTQVASFASAMLATSAGWLAYSHVAVTDLPMASFFSAAVLLSLPWLARRERSLLPAAAACLGLAALAKGLVPLALFLPVWVIGWRKLRDWLRPAPVLAFSVCALPWYILCTLRNGREFPRVLFIEQTFGRVASKALQHGQPVWFYIPVLLLLLYPWFPLLIFPGQRPSLPLRDPRIRALVSVAVFGFVLFSVTLNKLPGYLLPLMPAMFILIGVGLANSKRPGLAIVTPVILLGGLPVMVSVVPGAVRHGLRSTSIPWGKTALWFLAAAAIGIIIAVIFRKYAFEFASLLSAAVLLWFQFAVFPRLDEAASARPLWLANHPQCSRNLDRQELYGLYYYAERRLPDCSVSDASVVR